MRTQVAWRAWTLVGALLAAVVSAQDEMAELARMLRDSCMDETGVAEALLDRVNAGEALGAVATPLLKCYIKCVMETAGMMSDGVVDTEAVVAMLPEPLQKNAPHIRACGSPAAADACEVAFLAQSCWQERTKPEYFLI